MLVRSASCLPARRFSRESFQARLFLASRASSRQLSTNKRSFHQSDKERGGTLYAGIGLGLGAVLGLCGIKESESNQPLITEEQLSAHHSLETGVWMAYKGKVYDMTEFIQEARHPNDLVLLASGGSLDPYWDGLYQHHQKSVQVVEYLRSHMIGVLKGYTPEKVDNPYEGQLLPPLDGYEVFSKTPLTAQTASFPYEFRTQNSFCRKNHPIQAPLDVSLGIINGQGDQLSVSMSELKDASTFSQVSQFITFPCGGQNREFGGKLWTKAIRNNEYKGVLLTTLLQVESLKELPQDAYLVSLSHNGAFCGCVPLSACQDQTMVAHTMDSQPLEVQNGGPLRLLIPGLYGFNQIQEVASVQVMTAQEVASSGGPLSLCMSVGAYRDALPDPTPLYQVKVSSGFFDLEDNDHAIKVPFYAFAGTSLIQQVELTCLDADGNEVTAMTRLMERCDFSTPRPEQASNKATHWEVGHFILSKNDLRRYGIQTLQLIATDEHSRTQVYVSNPDKNPRDVGNNRPQRVEISGRLDGECQLQRRLKESLNRA